MEKAIAILIGNENGELSLRDFLAKVPETISQNEDQTVFTT